MTVVEEVFAERKYGVVRCGIRDFAMPPTIPELAREFGLLDTTESYIQIDEAAARRLIHSILYRDMAYNAEVMPETRASELANRFLAQFDSGTRYFSNGAWHLPPDDYANGVVCGPGWNPVTAATFDTGVLAIGGTRSGCLWIEDED